MTFLRALLLAVVVALATPAQGTRIDLEPSAVLVPVPGSVSLAIVVSGLDASSQIISSYDITLQFDALLLGVTGITFGSSLGGPINSISGDDLSVSGTANLFEVSLLTDSELDALQGDSVVLASLILSGLSPGISSVQFIEPLILVGRDGEVLGQFDVGGARVTGTVPEPGLVALLVLGVAIASVFVASPRSARFRIPVVVPFADPSLIA